MATSDKAGDRERALGVLELSIAEHWPGAAVGEIVAMAGDASSRRYLRCQLRSDAAGTAPGSVVVMLNEGSGAAISSDELGVFGKEGPSELPFVNVWRYLSRHTEALPRIYAVAPDHSALVLEDIGDVSLWQAVRDRPAEAKTLFGRAIDLVAELQTSARDDGSGCYAFRQAFDTKLFDWEFEHFLEYGVVEIDELTLAACRSELHGVALALDRLPKVFTHRDYHAWNIHVHRGRLRVIDFQDALRAPAMYDVASLLTDRTTPEVVGSELEKKLVERFAASGSPARFGDLRPSESYELCALQRVLKVIGRFHYLAEVKGKPRYLALVPAAITTARRLLARRSDLPVTTEVVEDRVKGGAACAQ